MNVTEALRSRYTCRAFRPDPLSRETIERILAAALRAPSWANSQPWDLFVAGGDSVERIRQAYLERFRGGTPRSLEVPAPTAWPPAVQRRVEGSKAERVEAMSLVSSDADARQAIMEQNYRLFGAPAVVYLCMDRALTPWSMFDMGSLAQSIMLAAQAEGVDSAPAVMLAAYPDILHAELDIPDDLSILLGVALGYGDADHAQNRYRSPRRPLREVARFRWF